MNVSLSHGQHRVAAIEAHCATQNRVSVTFDFPIESLPCCFVCDQSPELSRTTSAQGDFYAGGLLVVRAIEFASLHCFIYFVTLYSYFRGSIRMSCQSATEATSSEGACTAAAMELIEAEEFNGKTTCIIDELNQIYKERLQDIDEQAKGDFKLKCITYKEWVEMLMQSMRHMLKTLHILENEASKRIGLLERKLYIECQTEHNTDAGSVKSDLANLLELIRRAIEDKKWNTDGLQFKTITMKDIFGDPEKKCGSTEVDDLQRLSSQVICQNQQIKKLESEKNTLKTELDMKDLQLRKMCSKSCNKCKTAKPDDVSSATEAEDQVFKACISELKDVLRDKENELKKTLKENECLKSELTIVKSQVVQKDKVITNIRALTIEVADKHDQIQQMRTQMFSLEEDLRKAEKKIQFKDNVIKELRRDCKNASKNCTCSKRSISPGGRSPSPDKSVCWAKDLPTNRTGTSLMSSRCSDYTLDTIVALEGDRLHNCQIEESQRIQLLHKELEELFCIQNTHDATIEDQRRSVACQQKRIYELIQKLLSDLHKYRNKLAYIRNQMLLLTSPGQCDGSGFDSGYTSQEDMEPESSIVNKVKDKVQCLREENKQMRCQLNQLQTDVQSFKSTVSNCGKVFQEVASTISSMLHRDVSGEVDEKCEVNPFREALDSLNCELSEKESHIAELTQVKGELERELQCAKSKSCALHYESNAKEQTIYDLQETIAFQNNTIKVLEDIKAQLECDLNVAREADVHKKLTQLHNDKAKLESECQNQLTTISNLRQALESHKRGSGPAAPASGPASGGSNNSLWGWWRNTVHDV